MTVDQQIDLALAYFTDVEHAASFELLPGDGATMLSAPHAVLQTRNGAVKCAERFTGMLCRLLHEKIHCPVIYKTRHLRDDANFDFASEYRDALCQYIREAGIGFVLDLHQMKPERETEICIGTGYGANLRGNTNLPETVADCFREQGIMRITVDTPFAASNPNTVSATVAALCRVPAIQLEMNTRLLMSGYNDYCFVGVMNALRELVKRLNVIKG